MDGNSNDHPPEFVRLQVVPHEDTNDAPPSIEDSSNNPVPEIDISILNVMIPSTEFEDRLQDKGCNLHQLPKNTYKMSKIPPYGPKEKSLYYYHLTSIAIDYIKNFKKEKDLDRGWNKVCYAKISLPLNCFLLTMPSSSFDTLIRYQKISLM